MNKYSYTSMKMKFILIIAIFLIMMSTCLAQSKSFTQGEQQKYQTVKKLFEHFEKKKYDTTQRDFVFKHYVYFEHILGDTSKTKIGERVKFFDELFGKMVNYVDSVGINTLDAVPTRNFEKNLDFFKPFTDNGELKELLPLTLTFFDTRKPEEPLGVLLFEPKTHKLLSWIIINQGGYRYFLTFNLI